MKPIVILGVFVADLTFRNDRMPVKGQTLIGKSFKLGPGGKGSNQVIAARRAGAEVHFIAMLGKDPFGQMALDLYSDEGVNTDFVFQTEEKDTGAADIMVDDVTGDNAIIVVPGAADLLSPQDVEKAETAIQNSGVFMTNLEVPVETMKRGLELARKHEVTTIFNPAPAVEFPDSVYPLCDYFTPNETEAEFYTGIKITNEKEAKQAADKLINLGIKKIIITLGEKGLFYFDGKEEIYLQATPVKAIDTTGAGDAFNGGLAFGLSKEKPIKECLELANKVAGISTTKLGAGDAMPFLKDIN